ncbi:hypothetical protein [Agrobacterium pusense]|jgi:hypothetical protein|uniref:hypothetical protein n=1 Tax=Agrobacterium pusense TaxID=648995 RepID=UPI0028A946DC|nr:hypothetical protein [Agrobacterium pusense]
MTDKYSKSRQQAENAFSIVQKEFYAKNNAVEELEAVAQARDAKTLRLRQARLAKEMADRASKGASIPAKRGIKR